MNFLQGQKRYNQYSAYLKRVFGEKVYKIVLDAGFSCPNRDGTISTGGCIFCDETGSFTSVNLKGLNIKQQVKKAILEMEKSKFKPSKYISYFQAYTNTYKPVEQLKKIYDEALFDPKIVGISIGTRPDCVENEKLDLIQTYTGKYLTWLEFGLQSVHNKTLNFLNRGHDYKCFENAYFRAKKRNIKVCAHIILGLPNETKKDMLETAQRLAELEIDGVKLHVLCVLKNTKLEKLYNEGIINIMQEDEYIEMVCDFLEYLPFETTIQRLSGNGFIQTMLAPNWLQKKFEVLNKIDKEFERRNSFQGFNYILH